MMPARLALALLAASWPGLVAGRPKPNILLILADDYGWANMGAHRRDAGASEQAMAETHTPNMDALISEGVLLDRHYGYKVCAPSRSSLQSGRLAVHVNSLNTGVTVVNTSDPVSGAAGIPRNMTGMAQKLRQAGYRTHMVGKWDAGMATPEHTPWGRGYDTWLGYYQHANGYWRKGMGMQSTGELDNCLNSFIDLSMHNETYRGGVRDGISMSPECLQDPESHPACYEEQLFKDRALEIIRTHDISRTDAPLFLFYAFHLLHSPLQVPASYLRRVDDAALAAGVQAIDTQNRRLYAAMTMWMDEAIGEVVVAMKARGMWENTLVVFTSDNGGAVYEPGSGNNHPLKGGKFADWEGGVRVNAWLSGGFLPAERRGSRHSGVISIADWYATFCELAGVDAADTAAAEANRWLQPRGLPLLPPVDSIPQWGFILNGTNGRPRLHLSNQSLLEWPYKIVVGRQRYSRWQGELYPNCSTAESAATDSSPLFIDTKVFDVHLRFADTAEMEDEMTWVQDCGSGCLVDVEADPTEHADLAGDPRYAALLAKMQRDLQTLNTGIFNPARGEPTVQACEVGIDNGGYYGPFLDVDGWYSPLPPRTLGEHQKDAMLHRLVRAFNKEIVERGVAKMAREYAPKFRQRIMQGMDKCLTPAVSPIVV